MSRLAAAPGRNVRVPSLSRQPTEMPWVAIQLTSVYSAAPGGTSANDIGDGEGVGVGDGEGDGEGGGDDTGDWPNACATVRTDVVPFAVRAASHVTNSLNSAGLMDSDGSVPFAISWNVSCSQPPVVSALVTVACRSARVHVAATWSGALVTMGSCGGSVSATGQSAQLAGERMSPRPRELLYPQPLTAFWAV
ncbi:hypothetical protein D9M72_554890 [compost metagenome]